MEEGQVKKPKKRKKPFRPVYQWTDARGVRWRMVGARHVSEIADQTMRDVGLKLHGEP